MFPKNFISPIKAILASFILMIAFSMNSFAQMEQWQKVTQIETGVEPHFIIHDEANNKLHVFCTGVDLDWNGTQEEGESVPTWHVIDLGADELASTQVMEFPFFSFSMSNFRPSFDKENGHIYIPYGTKIGVYNAKDYSEVSTIEIGATVAAVSYSKGLLAVSVNPTYNANGFVYIYRDGEKIREFEGGVNMMDVKILEHLDVSTMPPPAVYYLGYISNGPYGAGQEIYKQYKLGTDLNVIDSLEVYPGVTPNYLGLTAMEGGMGENLKVVGGVPGIIANGSHYETMIHPNKKGELVELKIYTGTSGWNGPRQYAVNEEKIKNHVSDASDMFFISNYSNDFRVFSTDKGIVELQQIVPTAGKAEGIVLAGDQIFVANQVDAAYGPMNIIEVFEKGEFKEGEFKYTTFDNTTANQKVIFTVGEDLYKVDTELGIFKIKSDGNKFWEMKVMDLNIKSVCQTEINKAGYIAIGESGKIHIFKIADEIKKIDMIEFNGNPERIKLGVFSVMGKSLMTLTVTTDDNSLIDGTYVNDIRNKVSLSKEANIKELAVTVFDKFVTELSLVPSEDNTDFSIKVDKINKMSEETFNAVINGFSENSSIGFANDTLALITDYENNTMSIYNLNDNTFPLLSKINVPFTIGDIKNDVAWNLFDYKEAADKLAYTYKGNIAFFELGFSNYFTSTLPISNENILDCALLETEEATLIGAVTENQTVIYGKGTYVAINDDKTVEVAKVQMYPIPVKNEATVEVNLNEITGNINYEVFSVNGRMCGNGTAFASANTTFSISADEMNLSNGAYYLRITAGNTVQMIPFVVEK